MENNQSAGDLAAVYSEDRIMAILTEAFHGKKSLYQILKENNITEEIFYSWKFRYLNSAYEE